MRFCSAFGVVCSALLAIGSSVCTAQLEIDGPPIEYSTREVNDRVRQLQERIESEEITLEWDENHGWLNSLLSKLDVSPSSQTLVFSKTSLQFRKISPARPRAIYYNEDVYVGWVQQGEVIELAAVDPEQGAVFYTLEQSHTPKPVIKRDRYGECLSCHQSGRTKQVPGFLVRSLYVQPDGQPELRLGSITTDHRTAFNERFGGWYVTGLHGDMRHHGNVLLEADSEGQPSPPTDQDFEEAANRPTLPPRVRSDRYLEPTSDVVALMLLEHQSQFHNAVTKASFTARRALYQQANMNRILERPEEYQSESTQRRLDTVTRELVDYVLFVDEAPLEAPVQGRADFRAWFLSRGPVAPNGNSLRELDLQTKLMRYPCSYLIYSPAILALPEEVTDRFRKRMIAILQGEIEDERYAHVQTDRLTILEILKTTHPLFKQE